ncbi:MAG: bifunctional demethylmenaquinone methyltransferase/2-methoxy-6-polyprenyl-1,4-benzoquinol methylase UbiE [Marinifilaceae bacterium]|jgi:demethylmenaquinone methyltransferase/2-methoxy-6-polyprenyl-1,4-benzoquinol methylase|nr:bifunctional demethylmenaquinone methyltransferase/2-methoxy-6-polyprenyl-1,4-benzoquinol methylase UbiE [Marinifilaceae bacterium]
MNKEKEVVGEMFNDIAPKYDFLNHFLSMGLDKVWRKKAVNQLKNKNPKHILDVATGTGDFAIKLNKVLKSKVTGVDISEGMLKVGVEKISKLGLSDSINLQVGDSTNLSFKDQEFDAVTVAFGVRNFENLNKGLSEMLRVTKEDGKIVILEFSKPRLFPFKQLYSFYSLKVLPFIGALFSSNKNAYTYLPESVMAFPDGDKFLQIMKNVGYKNCKRKVMSLGIVTIYTGIK